MEIQDGGWMVVTNHFPSLGKNQINQRAAAFRGGWLRKHAKFRSEDTDYSVREMQIVFTIKFHFIPVRTAKKKP